MTHRDSRLAEQSYEPLGRSDAMEGNAADRIRQPDGLYPIEKYSLPPRRMAP
jgi:hypothetical protein